jgi:hypothetical protein
MAPRATPTAGPRVARIRHWLMPSPKAALGELVLEVVVSLVGLPPLAHLGVAVMGHLVARLMWPEA